MLPVVIEYAVSATNSTTAIAAAQGPLTNTTFVLTTTIVGTNQQRVTVTSGGNDTGIYFHIVGLNQANMTVQEFLAGGNTGSTQQSNLDYKTIISIQPSNSSMVQTIGSTASTVSAGLNGVGSTLWQIVNQHVTPSNIAYGTILQSGAATWSIQYTYDDPNNLASGVTYPQPFNLSAINNATATVDGSSNDPLFAWRLYIAGGTGTVRAIGIQAGIAGP